MSLYRRVEEIQLQTVFSYKESAAAE